MVTDCILDKRRSDVCWVRRMEDSRMCVRVSVIILLIVFGMILTTMVLLMKRRKRNELRVYDYGETGISTEVQYRFCPLHSSYHYTYSTSYIDPHFCRIFVIAAHMLRYRCVLPHGQHSVHEPLLPCPSWWYSHT